MRRWGEKPYYSLDYELKQTYGGKLYKLALNGGMSCPNRDGTLGTRGCIFCSAGGSGDFAAPAALSVIEQIHHEIERIKKKDTTGRYIAYFQAYTNTYAPVWRLRELFEAAIACPEVAVLSIATRPDCLPDEVIELLAELNEKKPVWVELGLQTIHEDTARYIRRGYELPCFDTAVSKLAAKHLTIITHVILGLPGETAEDMYETIQYLNRQPIQGVKLQLLHVLEGTDLAVDYRAGKFRTLSETAYCELICSCIARLRPDIVIHRLTGDGPSDILIETLWSRRKIPVLNAIHHHMKEKGIWQGCLWEETQNEIPDE